MFGESKKLTKFANYLYKKCRWCPIWWKTILWMTLQWVIWQ